MTREAFPVPVPQTTRKNPSPLAVYRAPVVTPTASFLPEQAGLGKEVLDDTFLFLFGVHMARKIDLARLSLEDGNIVICNILLKRGACGV